MKVKLSRKKRVTQRSVLEITVDHVIQKKLSMSHQDV